MKDRVMYISCSLGEFQINFSDLKEFIKNNQGLKYTIYESKRKYIDITKDIISNVELLGEQNNIQFNLKDSRLREATILLNEFLNEYFNIFEIDKTREYKEEKNERIS